VYLHKGSVMRTRDLLLVIKMKGFDSFDFMIT
jgi:hypothetical protein